MLMKKLLVCLKNLRLLVEAAVTAKAELDRRVRRRHFQHDELVLRDRVDPEALGR